MRVVPSSLLAFATALAIPVPAWAHEGAPGPPPVSAWDAAVIALLGTMALLYALGTRRLDLKGARVRRAERFSFWAGLAALVAAVVPPIDTFAARLFSVHMVQHELLMLVGAPLVIAGRPILPWLWALPDAVRKAAGSGLQARPAAALWRVLTLPFTAWALHGLAIWIWHAPALYEWAVRDEGIHVLQHATFVGTAVLFWWGLVYGRYGRVAYGAAVVYVFTTAIHTGLLGALFTFAPSPFYPLYVARAAASGVDPLSDQQLAGLYMWVPAGLVLMVFGLALFVAWLSEADRRARVTAAGRSAEGGAIDRPHHGIAPAPSKLLAIALMTTLAAGVSACSRPKPYEQEAMQLTGGGDPRKGAAAIRRYGCDSCHTIPGIPTADGVVGPPLTDVAVRVFLAGQIQNTPENMMRWIREPHSIEPGTAMPDTGVTERDSRDIVAYLYTLR